jgi:hypothetical protein
MREEISTCAEIDQLNAPGNVRGELLHDDHVDLFGAQEEACECRR